MAKRGAGVTRPTGRGATSRNVPPEPGRPWTQRPLWQVGLAAALVAAAASVLVYGAARAGGVPMELTEVFEDHFARMPVMNMAWAALPDGGVAGTVLAAACRRWAKRDSTEVRVFLMGDAVVAAMANQKLPDGYYHLDPMLGSATRQGADIGCRGTCMDARDHSGDAHQGHPPLHTGRAGRLTLWTEQVITFYPGSAADGQPVSVATAANRG